MSTTLLTAGLLASEKIIAKSLEYDAGSREAIKRLAPQVLQVNLELPKIAFYVCCTEEGIQLVQHYEGEVTAQITGSLLGFAKVFTSDLQNLKDSGVRLEGKATFIHELKSVARNLDLDWEEMLSQVFGDIIGPQFATAIRKQVGWSQDRAKNIARLTEEYLTHESGKVLSKPELDNFYSDVSQLALAADRLKVRFDHLALRLDLSH